MTAAAVLDRVRVRIAATPPCAVFLSGPLGICGTCSVSEEVHLLRDLLQAWSAQTLAHVALAKTTLTDPEWGRTLAWRDRYLRAGLDRPPRNVDALDPEVVELLVADGEILRALGAAVIRGHVLPVEEWP